VSSDFESQIDSDIQEHFNAYARKRGIQYARSFSIAPRFLWNAGSPAFAGDDD
jgi:hypothetical protein